MNLKNGFTLAEVLITLVIIGIIAAITIPSLMNKTNEQDTVVAVKKAYSVLGQAYQRVVAENGEIIPSALGSNNTEVTKTLGEMFAKQLNTQKICGMSTDGDCFFEGESKLIRGSSYINLNNNRYSFKIMLSDGMSVSFFKLFPNSYRSSGDTEPLSHVIADIYVDINGHKEPNTFGKDLFQFYVTKYGVLPAGTSDDRGFSRSTCRSEGFGCTAWVLEKGNVDYWHYISR